MRLFKKNRLDKIEGLKYESNVHVIGDLKNLSIGTEVLFQTNVVVNLGGHRWNDFKGKLKIGSHSCISYNTVIIAAGPFGISIGEHFDCGPNCGIFSSRSDYNNSEAHIFKPVVIGDNVILYHNVTISPGVTIGNNAVVGAGSVVLKDVDANTFVAGTPAKFVKNLG